MHSIPGCCCGGPHRQLAASGRTTLLHQASQQQQRCHRVLRLLLSRCGCRRRSWGCCRSWRRHGGSNGLALHARREVVNNLLGRGSVWWRGRQALRRGGVAARARGRAAGSRAGCGTGCRAVGRRLPVPPVLARKFPNTTASSCGQGRRSSSGRARATRPVPTRRLQAAPGAHHSRLHECDVSCTAR